MIAMFLSCEEGDVEIQIECRNIGEGKNIKLDNNKTLFLSFGGSYLITYVAQGLGNKIYFSMFHDNKAFSIFCLVTSITISITLPSKIIQVQISST